jgi:hypothetical protein
MKKIFLLLLSVICIASANAQLSHLFSRNRKTDSLSAKKAEPAVIPTKQAPVTTTNTPEKKDWSKIDLSKRPADHFMFQYGYDGWTGRPDSIKTTGFGRHFNFYVLFDKPFKSNPHYSVAYGAGIGTSNIFFDHEYVKVWDGGSTLAFDSTTRYKKSKITTIYLEVPVEIRYYSDPEHPNKSWKYAAGLKLGILTKAYFKGKDLEDANGNTVYGASYVLKEYDKNYFGSTLATASARIGYGIFSLNGDFQLTTVLKSGAGPAMHTFSIGLTISGL